MKLPKVSIIILNWNGWKNTIECLESLFKINYSNYEIILVDNGSTDQSVKIIKDWIDQKHKNFLSSKIKIHFILNDRNEGFVGGNNIAIKKILEEDKSDYLLLLNNDTVVSKEFLAELVKAAEVDAKIGIVGPKLYYYKFNDRKDIIQSVGAKINLFTGKFINYGDKQVDRNQFDKIRLVDYICGACLLIKQEVVKKVGLLDEKYFAYFEDADWGIRVKKHGFKVLYVPYSAVWHKGGESLLKAPEISEYYSARNIFWIEKRYANKFQLISFLSYYFFYRFPKRIVYCCISENKIKMLRNYLKGLMEAYWIVKT